MSEFDKGSVIFRLIQKLDEAEKERDQAVKQRDALLKEAVRTIDQNPLYEFKTIAGCTDEQKAEMFAEGWHLYHEQHHLTLPASGKVENGKVTDYSAHLFVTCSFRRVKPVEATPPPEKETVTEEETPLSEEFEKAIQQAATPKDEPLAIETIPRVVDHVDPLTGEVTKKAVSPFAHLADIRQCDDGYERKRKGGVNFKRRIGEDQWKIDREADAQDIIKRVLAAEAITQQALYDKVSTHG